MSPLFVAVRRAALLCVPFAAVFVAGVTLSPHASADYPGGGGTYPGNAGWHPVKPDGTLGNDTLGDPYIFYDYDWTRLQLHFDGVHGPPNYDSYSFDGDYDVDTISGFQGVDPGPGPPEYPDQPAPPDRTMNLSINGTSTVVYNWVPPLDPVTGQPDPTDFPAPPLFVLGRVDGRASADCANTSGDLTGISGHGSFMDGLGGQPVTYTTVPGDTGYQRSYAVLSAPSGSSTYITMSPKVTAHLTGTGPTTGSAWGGGWIEERVFPITLAAPDPLTNPLLGDGTNQFLYSADQPDGFLYVPGAIQVVGGGHDDSEWLINNNPVVDASDKVDLKIEAGTSGTTIPNTFTHQWTVSNDTIYVNTPQDPNNPYPGYQFNHWIFKGLPSSFSTAADGNHDVNLYVQGTKSQTAHIQTFYNGLASNWPSSDQIVPNWFHYYEQAFPTSSIYVPNLQWGGEAFVAGKIVSSCFCKSWERPVALVRP